VTTIQTQSFSGSEPAMMPKTGQMSAYGRSDPEALTACQIANLSNARNSFKQPKQATDNVHSKGLI
jgi:hypothetical protein